MFEKLSLGQVVLGLAGDWDGLFLDEGVPDGDFEVSAPAGGFLQFARHSQRAQFGEEVLAF